MPPCILGHGEGKEMSNIFGWNCILDDEESILIELIIRGFSRGEVASVMQIKAFFNNSPKVSINMVQMTLKAINPRIKVLIFHNLRGRTGMIQALLRKSLTGSCSVGW